MGTLDIILLLLFLPAVWLGISKGLVLQLASFAAVVVGIWVSKSLSPELAGWLSVQFGWNPAVASIFCYAVVFLFVAILLGMVGRLVTKAIKTASLGWVNRLAGLVFALGTTALLLGMAISLFEGLNVQWQFVEPETLRASRVWSLLRDFTVAVFPHLKDFFASFTVA
ncbi:MAG: CvpA family protein [Bacteroidales bacterium]|nr:CvpA family protein [Bacteroidales bacterium]